ncbi:hypothetical protein [Agromyces archimandritae]|uniref:TOMM leader peptide-binding protein n=1 Tax=Agromyces archimandritae TaxID=2781962 RepID=A0A975IN65_9MICO|nr:hypothetical protein [Agromyces archimandritae]QTX04283.1 hypothetical protein G127AT_13505 [Agromyces archimandritae]
MTPRIDPHLPIVWRSAAELQFGGAVARLVIEPDDVELQLVQLLRHGANRSTLRTVATGLGGDDLTADRLLTRLTGVLEVEPVRHAVAIDGGGPVADRIIALLDERRMRLVDPRDPAARLVFIVSDWTPQAATAAAYERRDLPHLPIVADDAGAVVGPLVVPGRTPCLACANLDRRREDPTWPAVAMQLIHRPAELGGLVAADAVVRALRIAERHLDGGDPAPSVTRIAVDGEITERALAFQPECGCRLLGGNATAPGPHATAGSAWPS